MEFEAEWWEFGYTEIFVEVGELPLGDANTVKTAELLNAAKGDSATEFKSFEATYWSEVRGTLDAYQPQIEDVAKYLFERSGRDPTLISPAEFQESFVGLRATLYNVARKVGLQSAVP